VKAVKMIVMRKKGRQFFKEKINRGDNVEVTDSDGGLALRPL